MSAWWSVASLALLAAGCDGRIAVGAADPARGPAASPTAAGDSVASAPVVCPTTPLVARKLASFQAASEVKGFAASDDDVVYVTNPGLATYHLWRVRGAEPAQAIDEVQADQYGSLLVLPGEVLWTPFTFTSPASSNVKSSLRRVSFAAGVAPTLISLPDETLSYALHALGPTSPIAVGGARAYRVTDRATEPLPWATPPGLSGGGDPATTDLSWAVTARRAYWTSGNVLYRTDLGEVGVAHAVYTGLFDGRIASDDHRVYWTEGDALFALDDDDATATPTPIATLSPRGDAVSVVHADASSVYVAANHAGTIGAYLIRVDKTSWSSSVDLPEVGDPSLAVFTPCSVVWSDGFALWRRPLPR